MRIIPIVICLALAACAPGTMQELQNHPIEKRSFEIEQNYQPVYRAILNQARRCFHGGYPGERLYVSGDLYYDVKTGHVSVERHSANGVEIYLAAEITAQGEARSKVDVLVGLNLWEGLATDVEGWARQTSKRCQPR